MFKYNKKIILCILALDLFFLVGAIVLFAFEILLEPYHIIIPLSPCVPLTILLVKCFIANSVMVKYESKMLQKDYVKADETLAKQAKKNKWATVLRINLFLIRGDSELYIFHYNSANLNFGKKSLRYYNYLLEAFRVYYDLILNNDINLTKVHNIQGIEPSYPAKIYCEAIALLIQGKFEIALNLIQQSKSAGGEFLQFVYAYIQYLCVKGLGRNEAEYLESIKKIAYNDFLKNIVNNTI